MMEFDSPDLLTRLEAASEPILDAAPFGIIRMESGGRVVAYNTFESQLAGLSKDRVVGRDFFADVAPCTNNYLIAERYRSEAEMDVYLDYVFTLRMKPTPVKLRLLKSPSASHMYMLVRR